MTKRTPKPARSPTAAPASTVHRNRIRNVNNPRTKAANVAAKKKSPKPVTIELKLLMPPMFSDIAKRTAKAEAPAATPEVDRFDSIVYGLGCI